MAGVTGTEGLPFQRLLNFRDVGTSVNTFSGRELLKTSVLFRSGRLDDATPVDRLHLATKYKLKTVIDLRTDSELVEQVQKNRLRTSDPEVSLRVEGVTYRRINFNGRSYTNALMSQLSYWNTARLITLYALGYRREAISVIGSNVMASRGLIGLAQDSLEHCTSEVKEVFDVLCEPDNYPILVHCTQGKDRTGLSIFLVLLLLDIPETIISSDYVLSEQGLADGKSARLEEIRSIGLPDEFAGCSEQWVFTVAAWLRERYGGVEAYLKGPCGIQDSSIAKIRSILLVPSQS